MLVPPLTWLFVPGHRPDRVEKALASRAHAVIVDLEDGVPAGDKRSARASVARRLGAPAEKPLFLRINPRDDEDLAVAASLPVSGVVVPKVEDPGDVPDGVDVHAMIESPRGLESAFAIASHPRVVGLSLGEADLRSLTGALEDGVDWARSRVVTAAVAAGVPRPPQAVSMHLRDLAGLERPCRRGRALGHLGRQAIHPDQLAVIERAYLPTAREVEDARATVATLERDGVGVVGDGTFVDAALLGAAQATIALADAYGVAS